MATISSMDGTRRHRVDPARRARIGEEKRGRTRRHVLGFAFSLLGREDGRTTRIDEICAAATISRGTFYNHFSGMTELFAALSYELSHEFNVAVMATIARLPTAAERAAAAVRYYLDRARSDPRWGWAMVNISAGGPIFGADTFAAARHTAQEGIDSGDFTVPTAELGRDLQVGIGLAAMITMLREPAAPDRIAATVRVVLRALGVDAERIETIIVRPLPEPAADDQPAGWRETAPRSARSHRGKEIATT